MLKRLKDKVLKEACEKSWDFFAFAAVPDSWLGWPELKHLRDPNRVKLYVISNNKPECMEMCEEPFEILGMNPTGEVLALHSNPADLERIKRWGYCCGYILAMPIRDHWFSVSIVLSRTKRRLSVTDKAWLQEMHIQHQLYAHRISPFRRGLLPQRQRQIVQMISEEKLDKEVCDAIYNAQTRKRGISPTRLSTYLKDIRESLEGAPEARWSNKTKRQIGILGVTAKYGLV